MALSSSNSIIQSHSLLSSSVAKFPRKRRIIRSRNNNLISTIAIIALSISSSSYAASPSFTGGLRGQQQLNYFEQQQQQQVVLDILSSRLPQHSQQSPRRPSHEDEHHNKFPPGHDDGHRRLVVRPSTTTIISTASDGDGAISEQLQTQSQPQPRRRTGEKGRTTENQKRKEANKRLKKMKQKDKNKTSGGGGGGGGRNKPNNKEPGRSNNKKNKKNKKPQGGGGGNSNGRSNKPKRPGDINKPTNNKPTKPGRPGKNKPGGGGGGKNKPNQQGGGGGRPNNNSGGMRPNNGSNNKPQATAQSSYIVVKPGIEDKDKDKSSKDDFDNIKPQSDNKPPKPKPQSQSSYIVVKPGIEDKEDKPKPNKPPKPQQQSQGIINIKPGKTSSPLELALAHLGIPPEDWDALKPNEQADIIQLIDGEFNIDSEEVEELITNYANAATAATDIDTDTTTSTATATSSSNNIIPLKWNFVPKLTTDTTSTLLDSFEFTSNLHWDQHPSWIISDDYAYSGSKSIQSGLLFENNNNNDGGKPIYSNLTLVTDPMFEGGVLTFQIKSGGSNNNNNLVLPIEAFWVEVDGMILLPPEEVAMKSSSSSGSGSTTEWVEYSVPVKEGEHQVKWVHVYNPFGLHSLPLSSSSSSGGLYMDELRYVPFTLSSSSLDDATKPTTQGGVVEMTNNNDAKWEVITNGNIVMASSSSINDVDSSGSADIEFDLYSLNGGQLTYRVQTSTTGPHDDLTIYINDVAVESVFGDMLGYESRSLDVPGGKARITFSHRTNPGKLSESVLGGLGDVGTDGKTWLKNLNFDAHIY